MCFSKAGDYSLLKFKRDSYSNKAQTLYKNIERDIYFWKLNIKYKLFQSLSKYITNTDVITNVVLSNSNKGITISCLVNGISFYTTCISAGGYNIQSYHYRYIVHTTINKFTTNSNNKVFKYMQQLEELEYTYNNYLKQKPKEAGKYDTLEQRLNTFNNNVNSYLKQINTLKYKIKIASMYFII